jgi:3-deoxy-D-arabino-heptulosonate 7-phosphate (DAHP) synthase class II
MSKGVTYRRVLDWMIGFIALTTFKQLENTDHYSAIAILHTLQFTFAHALGFSVFTSRLLATDLSQSHCNFTSHMESSLHRLTPCLQYPAAASSKTRLSFLPTTALYSLLLCYYSCPAEHFF